ncbi:MAG: hypothetical protein ACKV0T_28380 [Planctomycetales bacterium]
MIGGNAVAAWVARVDFETVRNTKAVNVLIRRVRPPIGLAAATCSIWIVTARHWTGNFQGRPPIVESRRVEPGSDWFAMPTIVTFDALRSKPLDAACIAPIVQRALDG